MFFNNRHRIELEKTIVRRTSLMNIALNYLEVKVKEKSIAGYLMEKGIKDVAIYGMGKMAELLALELSGSKIECKCIIDKNAIRYFMPDMDVIDYKDDWPQVDEIIITYDDDINKVMNDIRERKNITCETLDEILIKLL